MATSLDPHYQEAFRNYWEQEIQAESSLLDKAVMTEPVNGYRKKMDFLDEVESENLSRDGGALNPQDVTGTIRWLNVTYKGKPQKIPEFDERELGDLVSPSSSLIQSHGFMYNRDKDRQIVAGIEGNAYAGELGTTLVPLPSSQKVLANFNNPLSGGTATNKGLTYDKVARALKIFRGNSVNVGGELYAAIDATSEEDLMVSVNEIRSSDFSKVAPIDGDGVHGVRWNGMNWIVCWDGLLTTSSNITNCLVWNKRHVVFGDGERRVDMSYEMLQQMALVIYTRYRIGATRTQDKGVVLIESYHA